MGLELYHTCLLVEGLAEAMARFERTLGMPFLEPRALTVAGDEIVLTFSRHGPPFLELIEANGSSLYPHGAQGFHHLGFWSADPVAAMARLESLGARPLVVERMEDGGFLLAYYDLPDGLRVELIDPAISKPYIDAWRQA